MNGCLEPRSFSKTPSIIFVPATIQRKIRAPEIFPFFLSRPERRNLPRPFRQYTCLPPQAPHNELRGLCRPPQAPSADQARDWFLPRAAPAKRDFWNSRRSTFAVPRPNQGDSELPFILRRPVSDSRPPPEKLPPLVKKNFFPLTPCWLALFLPARVLRASLFAVRWKSSQPPTRPNSNFPRPAKKHFVLSRTSPQAKHVGSVPISLLRKSPSSASFPPA